ncbi:MAG: pentapeptide repeat-containing protein [Chloroflexi bacterium]|nr:pentapeptide repeat-containing protein [Chloroflexota bacterium]
MLRPYWDKFISWLTIGRVGLILLVIALPGIILSYQAENPVFRLDGLLRQSYTNIAWEFVSIAFTILIIDRIYQAQDARREKTQTIQQLRSTDPDIVHEAAEKLRLEGWLADGSLRQANLGQADLRRMQWQNADLRAANLTQANLQHIDLTQADLRDAVLEGADLRCAVLKDAQISEAQLAQASRLTHAIMPDGRMYDGRFHLPQDLQDAASAGFNTNDPISLARFYDVPVSEVMGDAHSPHPLTPHPLTL